MTVETIVCAHCGTPEDENVPGEPCARCDCTLTKIQVCSCHVFDFVDAGHKVFIGYRYVTHNPNCPVHG